MVPKRTTCGWQLLIDWKDGTQDWVPLKDLNDSNPVELAITNGIDCEPSFYWWVPHVLEKHNYIISKLKKQYWWKSHKFGIQVPKSIDKALLIDQQEGNTFWFDSFKHELNKIMVVFNPKHDGVTPEMIRGEPKLLSGFQESTCHWVFDVKMDLSCKVVLLQMVTRQRLHLKHT